VTVATDLGVPRSTARGWLGETPTVVVCLDLMEFTELLADVFALYLKSPILDAFWYTESLQSRLHPVRGKGRSHLNQFPDIES
jgi:hypothetical protein